MRYQCVVLTDSWRLSGEPRDESAEAWHNPRKLERLIDFETILRHKEHYLGRVAQVPKQFPNVLDDSDVVLPAVVPELAG